jgi:hypothetical protein
MKYIKRYENNKQHDRRMRKRVKEIRMSGSDVLPGFFVVFEHSRYAFIRNKSVNILTLGKVINTYIFIEEDGNGSTREVQTANIEIIDFLTSFSLKEKENKYKYDIGNELVFYLPLKGLLFMNSSLSKTKEEFEKIKESEPYCNWYLNNDVEKYNL